MRVLLIVLPFSAKFDFDVLEARTSTAPNLHHPSNSTLKWHQEEQNKSCILRVSKYEVTFVLLVSLLY
jgi:hypothetical protein